MATVGHLIAYSPIPDAVWWISDGKPRSEMTPEELAERHRLDRQNYLRMRERMAIDPAHREARLEVARRVKRNSRAGIPATPKPRVANRQRRRLRSEMTSQELADRHRRDRETRRRRRERMAADPDYREAQLEVARRATKKWQAKNRDNPDVIATRRARDLERWATNGQELNERKRRAYVGERAEQIRAANREWYAANQEARRAYRKAYGAANGDALRARERERQRQEYAQDPKKFNNYMRAWRAHNPTKARAYVRVSGIKRRAVATDAHFTVEEWLALLEEYSSQCGYCGAIGSLEADHRTPLCRGGSNTIDNIIPACRHCNRRKHQKTEAEFRRLLADEAARQANALATERALGPDGSVSAG